MPSLPRATHIICADPISLELQQQRAPGHLLKHGAKYAKKSDYLIPCGILGDIFKHCKANV